MKSKGTRSIETYDLPDKMLVIREVKSGQYEPFRYRNYIEPHRRNYFVLFLIKTGFIRHSIDFKIYDCRRRNVFFMTPQQVYFVETAKHISGITVSFKSEVLTDDEMMSPVIQNIQGNNLVKLFPGQYNYLNDLLSKMLSEHKNGQVFSQDLLRSYFRTLLIYLGRLYNQQNRQFETDAGMNQLVQRFRSLVSSNWHRLSLVSEYAGQMHITPGHLNHVIKQQTGKKAGEWIQERKLLDIKRLLLHSHDSIKEIAYKTGFEDPAYFNRFFKKKTGKTPLAFRTEIREKYKTKRQ